ncbi:unnamed protein product [Amoebophrya sp. A25]|nr:unnamed protein product [Amoebophrya sp. A25]|eukprot:GSA25T00021260001.1
MGNVCALPRDEKKGAFLDGNEGANKCRFGACFERAENVDRSPRSSAARRDGDVEAGGAGEPPTSGIYESSTSRASRISYEAYAKLIPPHDLPWTRAPLACSNAARLSDDGSGALCMDITDRDSGKSVTFEVAKEFLMVEDGSSPNTLLLSLIDLKRAVFARAVDGQQRLHFGPLDASMRKQRAERQTPTTGKPIPTARPVPIPTKAPPLAPYQRLDFESPAFAALPLIVKDPPFLRGTARCVAFFNQLQQEDAQDELPDSFFRGDPACEEEEAQLLRVTLKQDASTSHGMQQASLSPENGDGAAHSCPLLSFSLRSRSLREFLLSETKDERKHCRGVTWKSLGHYLRRLGGGERVRPEGRPGKDCMFGCSEGLYCVCEGSLLF